LLDSLLQENHRCLKMANIVGTVVLTSTTLVKVQEVGNTEKVLVYGRGYERLTVGGIYAFSDLVDGEKPFRSFKTTEKTKVTCQGSNQTIVGNVTFASKTLIKIEVVGGGNTVCVNICGCEKVAVGNLYELTHLQDSDEKDQLFKVYKATAQTQVFHLERHLIPTTSKTVETGDDVSNDHENNTKKMVKWKEEKGVNKSTTLSRPKSNVNNNKTKTESKGITQRYKPKGKTYKRSRHAPHEYDRNDPKYHTMLHDRYRRDTKSGGMSWHSRIRLDPSRVTLGSDRFNRPRSDRIYSVSVWDSDDEHN